MNRSGDSLCLACEASVPGPYSNFFFFLGGGGGLALKNASKCVYIHFCYVFTSQIKILGRKFNPP